MIPLPRLLTRIAGGPPRRRTASPNHPPRLEPLEDRTVPSTIQGTVFHDLDDDGARGPGEPGLQGWLVYLDANRDGQPTPGEAYTRTDAAGGYSFTGLPAGDHVVAARLRQPSYDRTGPAGGQHEVTYLTDGETATGLDFGNRLTARGAAEPELLVNTTTSGAQALNQGDGPGRHAVAADANGNFIVVWAGNGPGDADGVFAQRFQADGSPRGSEFRVNVTTAGGQAFASVAADADGDFVVTWQSGSDVKSRLFHSDGSARTGELQIKSRAFVHDVAMDADGDFVVVYEVAQNNSTDVLYAQRFTAAGKAQGKAIKLNTTSLANDQASVAMDSDGDFVVAWEGAFQRVDRLGAKQGPVVSLPGSRPVVGMDAAGNFVIARARTDISPFTREAQLYLANGAPSGAAFPVGPGDPWGYPVVAMSPTGEFAVAWRTAGGNYLDVYVQRFDADGTPLGDSVVANATAASSGVGTPAVAIAGGALAVVWHGPGPGDDAGVFRQVYSTGSALLAEGGAKTGGPASGVLTEASLPPLVDEAVRRWLAAGQQGVQREADIRITDLGGATLGLAAGNTIWLDDDAAGWGWFVDPTPSDDSEFLLPGDQGEQGRMDLLTALMHEMGHLLGLDHADEGVMRDTLAAGTRAGVGEAPTAAIDHVFSGAAPAPALAPPFWGDVLSLLGKKARA